MSLEQEINETVKVIPDCLAAGYVDMKTGMLLGVKTVDSHPQEVLDLVAAATGDLFQGPNVVAIEAMFKKARGVDPDPDHHYFQEIIVLSENLLHVFQRAKRNVDMVLVVVCRVSANLGMVLTKARMQLSKVEAAL